MMKKGVIIFVLAIVFLLGIYFLFAMNFVYSDGYRVGTLVKITKKGYIFKTWEGQINVGGISDMGGEKGLTSIWEFSVLKSDSEKVLSDIDEAVAGEYRVKLFYNEMPLQFSWRGDTKYFVYKVEKVKHEKVE